MRLLRLCGVLVLLAAPAFAAPFPMVGAWFGTGQPDDRSEMYIDYFLPDGAFRNHHRWCRQGEAQDIAETGHWKVEGNILTIDIATVKGTPKPRRDVYKLLSVDARTQNYIFLANNFPYKSRRVDAKFPMPPCDLTS